MMEQKMLSCTARGLDQYKYSELLFLHVANSTWEAQLRQWVFLVLYAIFQIAVLTIADESQREMDTAHQAAENCYASSAVVWQHKGDEVVYFFRFLAV